MERPPPSAPSSVDSFAGLAYDVWLPPDPPPWPGIVVIHGAGSRRQNHADFARLARGAGWAVLTYDQRGHGESAGRMSPDAVADAGDMARLLGSLDGVDPRRVCARGSSLGGFIAIHAAAEQEPVAGAIAICPPDEELLLEGIRRERFEMEIDEATLVPWLQGHDLREAVGAIGAKPLILLHADGDEQVPVDISRQLHARGREPKKLIVVPGGHHRSVQHDPELQGAALRWLGRALAGRD